MDEELELDDSDREEFVDGEFETEEFDNDCLMNGLYWLGLHNGRIFSVQSLNDKKIRMS
jgi:hypothetical protein